MHTCSKSKQNWVVERERKIIYIRAVSPLSPLPLAPLQVPIDGAFQPRDRLVTSLL